MLVVREEVGQPKVLRDLHILVLGRDFDESVRILVRVGDETPTLTWPEAQTICPHPTLLLFAERPQSDEGEGVSENAVGQRVETRAFYRGVAEETGEER